LDSYSSACSKLPLATVILFFELNVTRNVSFNRVLMLVASGGVVSLFVALVGFEVSNLDWLGASSAGIVEEIGKLLAVIIVARSFRGKYILNGLLFGAAVGAGFAFFESAGYAFDYLERTNSLHVMFDIIQTRAFLTPFGHVAWTAIAAAALWRVKGDGSFQPGMLLDSTFLKTMVIPMMLHMLWNAPVQHEQGSQNRQRAGFVKIRRYRKSKSANPLSTLLTSCNASQRASSYTVWADGLSGVGLNNGLLVGRITIRVKGMTAPSTTPPMSQNVAPATHAAVDDSRPKAANVACMTVARR